MLSCTENSAAVNTGTVVSRNTVSMVILVLVMWAVTATLTGHVGTLEIIHIYVLVAVANHFLKSE